MLRHPFKNSNHAQIILEYTVIAGVIVMVLLAMNVMIKRGVQGMIKVVADQVGNQINAEQRFDESGHMESQYTTTRTSLDKTTREFGGVTTYEYDDIMTLDTTTVSNLGFTEE